MLDDDTKKRIQLITDAASLSFDKAAQYDNTVLGLGYVGFYALWAGVAHDVPRWTALWSVCLVGFSLIAYIGWNILQMLERHKGSMGALRLIGEGVVFDDDFLKKWDAEARRQNQIMAQLLYLWKSVFYVSFALGILGATLLFAAAGYQALAGLAGQNALPIHRGCGAPHPL